MFGAHSICKACKIIYREENRAEINEKAKQYWLENKEKIVSPMNDAYIRRLIRRNTNIKDVPYELIEAKRVQIQIKRFLKESNS